MKLKDWADKTGVKYLTAYRWFKAGTLPVKAYQTDSGTIIVEETEEEKKEDVIDATSLFFSKTLEFSKNEASIEDFASYIFSTFQLKLLSSLENNKPKIKPSSAEVRKHFQQFFPKDNKIKSVQIDEPSKILDKDSNLPFNDLSSEEYNKILCELNETLTKREGIYKKLTNYNSGFIKNNYTNNVENTTLTSNLNPQPYFGDLTTTAGVYFNSPETTIFNTTGTQTFCSAEPASFTLEPLYVEKPNELLEAYQNLKKDSEVTKNIAPQVFRRKRGRPTIKDKI